MADRMTAAANNTRQNTWGGTLGSPIVKNKLFNFFAYEGMKISSPLSIVQTLPSGAQRTGDFSQTLNTRGALDTIYDPFSTITSGSAVTRTPFPNNIIPSSRMTLPRRKSWSGVADEQLRPGQQFQSELRGSI